MTRVALLLAALTLLPAAPARAQDAARIPELLKQGDEAYRKRYSEKAHWEAIYFYKEILKQDADNFDALWRLARAYYSLSDAYAAPARKRELGAEGLGYGERAAKLKPNRVEGWFYGVICLGEYSLGIGLITALRQGVEGKFRTMAEKALSIDPGFDYAGPPRTWGVFYMKLPWPKRDYKKAELYLLDAKRRAPQKLRNFFYLAQLYDADGRKGDALAMLRECVGSDPSREDRPDGARYQRECKSLLKKLGGE